MIIVSGQPRSGTSLMMRILDSSEIPVIADERRSYETTRTTALKYFNEWMFQIPEGSALKVLFPHVGYVPFELKFKLIWMTRNHREQARSQRQFGGKTRAWESEARKFIKKVNRSAPEFFRRKGVLVHTVNFDQLVRRPRPEALEGFLGRDLDFTPVVRRSPKAGVFNLGELEGAGK